MSGSYEGTHYRSGHTAEDIEHILDNAVLYSAQTTQLSTADKAQARINIGAQEALSSSNLLPVTSGGTGATDAAGARAHLGVASTAEVDLIREDLPNIYDGQDVTLDFDSNEKRFNFFLPKTITGNKLTVSFTATNVAGINQIGVNTYQPNSTAAVESESVNVSSGERGSAEFETSLSAVNCVRFYFKSGAAAGAHIVLTNIQIEEGPLTPYSPHTVTAMDYTAREEAEEINEAIGDAKDAAAAAITAITAALNDANRYTGYLNASLTPHAWTINSSFNCNIVPVVPGQVIYVRAAYDSPSRIALMVNLNYANGAAPKFSADSEWSGGTVEIGRNATKTFTVPADARWMYIPRQYGATDRTPTELTVNGVDCLRTIRGELAELRSEGRTKIKVMTHNVAMFGGDASTWLSVSVAKEMATKFRAFLAENTPDIISVTEWRSRISVEDGANTVYSDPAIYDVPWPYSYDGGKTTKDTVIKSKFPMISTWKNNATDRWRLARFRINGKTLTFVAIHFPLTHTYTDEETQQPITTNGRNKYDYDARTSLLTTEILPLVANDDYVIMAGDWNFVGYTDTQPVKTEKQEAEERIAFMQTQGFTCANRCYQEFDENNTTVVPKTDEFTNGIAKGPTYIDLIFYKGDIVFNNYKAFHDVPLITDTRNHNYPLGSDHYPVLAELWLN